MVQDKNTYPLMVLQPEFIHVCSFLVYQLAI